MNIDDEIISDLIEKSINIQYDSKSCSYEVHARSDTVIIVTSFHLQRHVLAGVGGSLVSRAIDAI